MRATSGGTISTILKWPELSQNAAFAEAATAAAPADLLRSITDPLISIDRAWLYAYVNEAAEKLLGRPASEIIGHALWDVFPAIVGTRLYALCAQALHQSESVFNAVCEEHYQAAGCWYEIEIRNTEEAIWIWFRDVTLQKQAQQKLRQEEERYRTLFQRVPTALYRTSADGALLDVNDALLRLLGYPDRETLLKVNAADVYVDAHHRTLWKELLTSREEVVVVIRDRCYDGSIIWVRDTARAVRDDDGAIVCYEGMLEDVTRQREAEEALRDSEERFRLLAQASDDVIWDWDVATGEVRWNDALRRVLGYPADCMGRGIEQTWSWWSAHMHADDRDQAVAGFQNAVATGAVSWRSEYRFRRLDGSYAQIVDRVYIGRGPDGQPMRIIGALLDTSMHGEPSGAIDGEPQSRMPLPPTSDATLIDWISQGDTRALDDLYARHAATLFTIARSLVGTKEEAEEVVADVFVAAWEDASRYTPARGSVLSWLNTMCRSRSGERSRKGRRREKILEGSGPYLEEFAAVVRHDSHTASLEDRMLVKDSLAKLPQVQRQVIELAYFNGMSHSEIAASLAQPLGTVKTRVRDGMAKLRVLMESDGPA